MNLSKKFFLLSLVIFSACGGRGGEEKNSYTQQMEDQEVDEGTYHAHLRPLNPRASGFIPHGRASFSIAEDKLSVITYLDDDSSVTHRQSVHTGSRCPIAKDDRNADGFLDYQEALRVVGPVLIPLDSDLSAQEKGADIYPQGTGFTYSESVGLPEIMEDLWKPDTNPFDELTHLPRGSMLKLDGRVVLIHGTFSNSSLPTTLSGRGPEAANLSLPVVCGVISILAN